MGLFEKARHLSDARLRSLAESGAPVTDDSLRRAILELDGYRRELGQQLAKHRREEAQLIRSVSERSAGLALWQARRVLAQSNKRADLVDAAASRAEHERAERDLLERRRTLLQSAVANLTVNLEKVDRTMRLLRSRKRTNEATAAMPGAGAAGATGAGAAGAGAASTVTAGSVGDGSPGAGPASSGASAGADAAGAVGVPSSLDDPLLSSLETPFPSPPEDPIEAEFQRLEYEEVVNASAASASRRDRKSAAAAAGQANAGPAQKPPTA